MSTAREQILLKCCHIFTIVCKGREPISSDAGIKKNKYIPTHGQYNCIISILSILAICSKYCFLSHSVHRHATSVNDKLQYHVSEHYKNNWRFGINFPCSSAKLMTSGLRTMNRLSERCQLTQQVIAVPPLLPVTNKFQYALSVCNWRKNWTRVETKSVK